MDLTNIDFARLDLDKYLDWLQAEYARFSRVCTLPKLESLYNDYSKRAFFANSHYIRTRGKNLPPEIARLYEAKKNHYKKQIDELQPLPISVIFFNNVVYDKTLQGKKYGLFTVSELEDVHIETQYFDLYRGFLNDVWKPDFKEQITPDFEKSPLPKTAFYQLKIKTLKENSFKYLEHVINGSFIYNLNEAKTCLDFFLDFSRIWEIHYLETELLKLSSPSAPLLSKHTLNPNFQDFEAQVKIISETSTPLFIGTLDQWENLFSNEITPFTKPIELRQGVSKADLRRFIDNLKFYGLIRTGSFLKVLADVNAFSLRGNVLTANDYKNANNGKNYPNTRNADKVEEIFTALKVKD